MEGVEEAPSNQFSHSQKEVKSPSLNHSDIIEEEEVVQLLHEHFDESAVAQEAFRLLALCHSVIPEHNLNSSQSM